jgi:putative glutamine amidotransferase
MIPLLDDEATLKAMIERMGGLLLCGGGDVAAERYGERNQGALKGVDPTRDRVELFLTRLALAEGKPVFGICRGLQLLNVAAGGTLIQDIAREAPDALAHPRPGDQLVHGVSVAEDTLLHEILWGVPMMGETDGNLMVNSSHHQAVKDVAKGLRAAAWAPDGVIEAIEGNRIDGPFVLGVQWHPERLAETAPRMARLFGRFVQASAQWVAR